MTCPYCGTENEASFQFCKTCGAKLAAKAAPQPQAHQFHTPQFHAPQPQPVAPQPVAPQSQYQPQYQPQPVAPQPQAQPQYRAPQPQAQPQYRAPQPQAQPQYRAPQPPVAPAPQKPKKDIFGDLIAKVKAIDLQALLKDPKKLIVPGAAVLAVLVLIVLIAVIGSAGGSSVTVSANGYYTFDADGDYSLVYNGKILEEGLDYISTITTSMDGSVLVYEVDDEIFVCRGKESVFITDEGADCYLSLNGDTLAVIDYDDVLTVYNTKTGDGTELAEDVVSVALSPNGKSVAYVVYDDEPVAYLYKGKDSIELGEELVPLALTDNAKVIYCYDTDKGSLCTVDTKGETEKIVSSVDPSEYILNEDHSQIIIYADGKWYASNKGGEKQKLTSNSGFDVLTYAFQDVSYSYSNGYALTIATDDLRGSYVSSGGDLYYLNKSWEMERIDKDLDYAFPAADGKTLFYTNDDDELFKLKSPTAEPIELASDVSQFMPTPDGSAVYFVNYDDELMYQKGTRDAKDVCDDVEEMIVANDGTCLFLSDGSFFTSRNGGKKVKITDEFEDLYVAGTGIYLETDYDDGEYTVQYSAKGGKFKTIYEP